MNQLIISHPVYIGADNRFPLRFRTRDLVTGEVSDISFSTITRVVVSLEDETVLVDTTSLGSNDEVDLSGDQGVAYFRLGGLNTLPSPGEYNMRFKVYEGGADTLPTVLVHEDHLGDSENG